MLQKIGWLPDRDAPDALGFVDGADDLDPVAVLRHPSAMLRDDPQLWETWDEWRLGYRYEPDAIEYRTLSAWQIEALSVLRAARERSRIERMKRESRGVGRG